MYLLDTNICIFLFKENSNVLQNMRSVKSADCFISEITLAELKFGALRSVRPDYHLKQTDELATRIRILSIQPAIDIFAREKARLVTAGKAIPDFDILIGATALVHDLTMVTNNTEHFNRLTKIQLEDWSQPPSSPAGGILPS